MFAFVLVSDVHAVYEFGTDCDPGEVMFVGTMKDVHDSDYDPAGDDIVEYCVEKDPGKDTVTFAQLRAANIEAQANDPLLIVMDVVQYRHGTVCRQDSVRSGTSLSCSPDSESMGDRGRAGIYRFPIVTGGRHNITNHRSGGKDFFRYYFGFKGNSLRLYPFGVFGEPAASPSAVTWSPGGENKYDMKHGQRKTLGFTVDSIKDGETVTITCVSAANNACAGANNIGNGAIVLGINNGDPATVTIQLDSRKIVDLIGRAPPFTTPIVLRGTTNNARLPKYKDVTIQIGIGDFDCSTLDKDSCETNNRCFFNPVKSKCANRRDPTLCTGLPQNLCGKQADGKPAAELCRWQRFGDTKQVNGKQVYTPSPEDKCLNPSQAHEVDTHPRPPGYTRNLIPNCAWSGNCRDVNTLVEVLITYGTVVFRFIGALALVMFVYGGFTMILSMGNPERVKKGRDILAAAVVGIIIVFTAFLIVSFLLDALNVGGQFRPPNL